MFRSFLASVQKWFIRRHVRAFERANDYDMTYVHEILDSDPNAVMILNRVSQMSHYAGPLPRDVAYAIGLVAAMHEDCGPCLQLGVTMAMKAHVPHETIARVISGEQTNNADVDLAVAFCQAVLRQAPNESDLREMVLAKFGRQGLTAMAFSLTGTRMYPMLKRVLGHAHCYPAVNVGNHRVKLATHAVHALGA